MREDSEEDDLPGMKMTEKEEIKDTVVECCLLLYADEDIYVMYTHFYNTSLSFKKKFLLNKCEFYDALATRYQSPLEPLTGEMLPSGSLTADEA